MKNSIKMPITKGFSILMKSCDDCNYKLEKKTENKYRKPRVHCTKRKCIIPTADEATWCKFYDEKEREVLKTS